MTVIRIIIYTYTLPIWKEAPPSLPVGRISSTVEAGGGSSPDGYRVEVKCSKRPHWSRQAGKNFPTYHIITPVLLNVGLRQVLYFKHAEHNRWSHIAPFLHHSCQYNKRALADANSNNWSWQDRTDILYKDTDILRSWACRMPIRKLPQCRRWLLKMSWVIRVFCSTPTTANNNRGNSIANNSSWIPEAAISTLLWDM